MANPTVTIPIRFDIDERSLDVLKMTDRSRDRRLAYVALLGTWATAIAVALLLMSCVHGARPAAPLPFSADEQARAAVAIEMLCVGDPYRVKKAADLALSAGYGSGAIVGRYSVVTAAHVINCSMGSPVIGIVDARGHRRVADIAAIDYVHDVARLTVREPFDRGRAVCIGTAHEGQLVSSYTAVPERGELHGRVIDVRMRAAGWRRVDLGLSMHVVAGNSGSAIYDNNGCIVGVVTHSVALMGLCGLSDTFCAGWGATLLGKGVLP